jgi:riboflavin synthase
MYTGIVSHTAQILDIQAIDTGMQCWVSCEFDNLQDGESIAVDGICFTVSEHVPGKFRFEVSPETLAKTTAGRWQADSVVNLERSLTLNDRVGGHMVTGHIDTTACLRVKEAQGDFVYYEFAVDKSALPFIAPKGCVSINGVSLTVNKVLEDGFAVMLIPHTLGRTNLSMLNSQDRVNIEYDYFARYVIHYLNRKEGTDVNP